MNRLSAYLIENKLASVVLFSAIGVFAWRCYLVGGAFVEDTYITFRYALHLAEGYGLVWNMEEAPAEGFTSLLHIVLLAASKMAGLSLEAGSYLISLLSFSGLVATFILFHKRVAGAVLLPAILMIGCYLAEGRTAIHATAGMETPLFMLLVFISQIATYLLLTIPSSRAALFWAGTGLLALWSRPDAFFFLLAEAILLISYSIGDWRAGGRFLARHVISAFASLLVVGLIYLVWKYHYYGYILPNTFYVKSGGLDFPGLHHVAAFLQWTAKVLSPPVVLLLVATDFRKVASWLGVHRNMQLLAIMLIPPLIFLGYFTTTIHEVCYANRFEYPAYIGILMAASMLLCAGFSLETWTRRTAFLTARISSGAYVISVCLVFLLSVKLSSVYFPWSRIMATRHYMPIAFALQETGLNEKATLIFDSAGTVAYFSKFHHIDPVGLTDNYLSGRNQLSAMQREKYLWSHEADVYIGPEPPATRGATDHLNDPRVSNEYAMKILMAPITAGPYVNSYGRLSDEERREALHYRMRELRDNWDLVREMPYPVGDSGYTHFVYVRKDSPYYATIVEKVMEMEFSKEPFLP